MSNYVNVLTWNDYYVEKLSQLRVHNNYDNGYVAALIDTDAWMSHNASSMPDLKVEIHAHWIIREAEYGGTEVVCSNWHGSALSDDNYYYTPYCPECGATMDLEIEDETK